jgi:hypothetical protein
MPESESQPIWKRLPWEWVFRAIVLLSIAGWIALGDKHFDSRYDARYVAQAAYEADKKLAAAVAAERDIANARIMAERDAATSRERQSVKDELGDIKADLKALLRETRKE